MAEGTEIELIDIDLDWHAPTTTPGPSDDVEPERGGRLPRWLRPDPRWLVAVAVIGYLGWLIGSSGDGEPEPAAPAAPTTSVSPAETVTVDDDRAALAGDPSLDLAAAIDELTPAILESSYLEMQVNPNGVDVFAVVKPFDAVPGGFRLAYIGADGRPVVIDTSAGSVHSAVDEVPLGDEQDFVVLNDATGVIGLTAARPDTVLRVADGLSVLRRASGELMAVRETPAGVDYGTPTDPDAWGTLPLGAEFWVEPGVGVFLTPSSGGVFEVGPDGVDMVTPYEQISTNGDRRVEVRRVAGPDEYWVVSRDGREWRIDRERIDVTGDLAISPDGEWIYASGGLVGTPLPAFYGVETGTIVEVESRADRLPPVWAPDSSFVALLDVTRSCIWLNFVAGENGCIVLDKLGVPPLEAASVVVY